MLLRDKVVVVSGVGPGLGKAIAVESAKAGADLVPAARTESRLGEVAKEIDERWVLKNPSHLFALDDEFVADPLAVATSV